MEFGQNNTVKVDFEIMERLIRDSERLASIRDYAKKHKYVTTEELRVLLGVEKECER